MTAQLIVTADDVGLHPGMNAGAIAAHARGIVTAHQGHICVDSVVGRGSTFRFTIPAA